MLQLLRKNGRIIELHAEVSPKVWYTDEAMDLILNVDSGGAIRAFQLCYGKPWRQKALMWTEAAGTGHFVVDDGEARPTENRTPLLQPGGRLDAARLAADFMQRADNISPELAEFVVEKLTQYAASQQVRAAPPGNG